MYCFLAFNKDKRKLALNCLVEKKKHVTHHMPSHAPKQAYNLIVCLLISTLSDSIFKDSKFQENSTNPYLL